jgi:hypothetical protein
MSRRVSLSDYNPFILIQNVEGAGLMMLKDCKEVFGSLAAVKEKVVAELQPHSDYHIDPEDIYLFRGNKVEPGMIKKLVTITTISITKDVEFVNGNYVYVAVEKVYKLPRDKFCIIAHSQVCPAVPSHPTKAACSFMNVSPLFCAGAKDERLEMPWWNICVEVVDRKLVYSLFGNGMSLRTQGALDERCSKDPMPDVDRVLGDDEEKNILYTYTEEQYSEFIEGKECKDFDAQFLKKLLTTVDFEKHQNKSRVQKPKKLPRSKKRCRQLFFVFC